MSEWVVPPHGGQLRGIAERFGVDASALIDFSVNVNPDGPPPGVVAALRAALDDAAVVTSYPDLEQVSLRDAIAGRVGVKAEWVVVGNGFVPVLEAAVRGLGVRSCLLPVPAFGEYRRVLEWCGVAVGAYGLSLKKGFAYEPEAMMHCVVKSGHDAILLANPQNPSGVVCGAAGMRRLIELADTAGVTVLLDEAFIDYVPAESVVGLVEKFARLVVFRSVTKFYAVPGLRVAYCVSGAAGAIAGRCAPWAVSTLAGVGVCAALQDVGYAEETRRRNLRRRAWLVVQLRGIGAEVVSGAANFLLVRVGAERLWERMIVERGIVMRSCANFEGLAGGWFRVAVRAERENELLVAALRDLG